MRIKGALSMRIKTIGWAYPFSGVAHKTGHSTTGCWYVACYDEQKPMEYSDIVFSSNDKLKVKEFAEDIADLQYSYWSLK
jgi:hypothetical protein